MTTYKLQPSSHTDHITEDGVELQQLPYPFFIKYDRDGYVGSRPVRAIGFQKDLARMRIDLGWWGFVEDPQQAVGMYLVTSDDDGGWSVHTYAIQDVEVIEDPS